MMKTVIWILLVIALAAGGWYGWTVYQDQQLAEDLAGLQTVQASRGNLTATVGATGVVRTNQTAVLAWQTSGYIDQVYVDLGDQVSTDQALADLQQTTLPQNIILARVDLVNSQKALEDLNDTALALAQAEQGAVATQDQIKNLEYRLENLQTPANQTDIDSAEATVLLAKIQLDKAWDRYQPYENKPENNVIRANLFQRYTEAQQQYDAAVRRLNNLKGTSSDLTVEVAQKDLDLARAQLADFESEIERLKAGPDSRDVEVLQARIDAAQATLNLARLIAPFPGTVTDINIKAGDQVTPGSVAFRLDDLSHLLVDLQVSEIDINRIRVGQRATLSFDAIPNKEYDGVVSQVDQVGSATQGVVDFTVTIELNNADEQVLPGMTAAVNIVVNELDDVLLVPNRAVRVVDGQRVVYILNEGESEPEAVNIQLGASSEINSEVVGGDLREGELIVLNPPTVFETDGPPPFVRR